jgi:non-specific protein-tyrosine kinase
MDFKEYLRPLRRWWLLILIVTAVSTLSSSAATLLQEPLYQTKVALMIGQAIEDPNPNNTSLYLTQQLAQSYAEIARRKPVRQATMEALGLSWLPEYQVTIVPNTQLLEITVIDSNPARAQAVANTLAEQLVRQSPAGSQAEEEQRQAFVSQQLDSLERQIAETEAMIRQRQEEASGLIGARQIAEAQSEIAALQATLVTLQGNYATLLASTSEGAINTLSIIEPADLPGYPINANRTSTILLGAAIGLALAVGAAYLLEYLDDTLKTPEEIIQVAGLPIIASIGQANRKEQEGPILTKQLHSPMAEAFRSLRTNLDFAAVDRPLRTILITGPTPGGGKTTVAIDLAIIFAQSGRKTLLLDADLRRPMLHQFLDLNNQVGLSDLFLEQVSLEEATQPSDEVKLLSVLASGKLPAAPAELLSSHRMDQILADARDEADVVIIDCPPLIVADAVILAAKVDGVVLVVRSGQTPARVLKAAMEQLRRANAQVIGIVFNGIPGKDAAYHSSYRYYYGRAGETMSHQPNEPAGAQRQARRKGLAVRVRRDGDGG